MMILAVVTKDSSEVVLRVLRVFFSRSEREREQSTNNLRLKLGTLVQLMSLVSVG